MNGGWLASYFVACSSASPMIAPPVSSWPTPEPLRWVDPARCLSPCGYDGADHLLAIDATAKLAENGAHRVIDVARPALEAMITAASSAGSTVAIVSAFRSYEEQTAYLLGTSEIGRVARPGHSEHQLGTTVDFDSSEEGFAWLSARSADYGFVLSFPRGKQKTTGLRYEAWHFRYVGTDIAKAVRDETGTLEEYFRAHPEKAMVGDCSDCPLDLSRSACGSAQPEGECVGTVLSWCFDGALAQVDCSATGLVCDTRPDADCR